MDFAITVIYLIISYTRPQNWIAVLYHFPIMDWFTLPALIVIGYHFLGQRKQLFFETPQVWLMLAFWFWMVMSFVTKGFVSEVSLTFQYFGRIAVPFLLIVCTVTTKARMKGILFLFFCVFVFYGIHGYLQHTRGFGFGGMSALRRGTAFEQTQGFGTFNGPNEFGALFAAGLVMLLGLVRTRWRWFIPCLPFGVLFFFNLWWTQSRQSVVTLASGVALALLPRRIFNSWIGIGLATAVLFGAMQFHSRWSTGPMRQDKSVGDRAGLITGGIDVFKRNPVFGVGRFRAYDAVGRKKPLHNSYLQILVENGFPGLFLFVSLGATTLLSLYWIGRWRPDTNEDSEDIAYARMLLALVGAILMGSYFTNRPYHVDTYCYIAVGAAHVQMTVRRHREIVPKFFYTKWMFGWGAVLMAAATWGVIVAMHLTSKFFWRSG